MFEYTAKGRYYKTYLDDVYQTQHTTEREAIESANRLASDNPGSKVIYRHEYEVDVSLVILGGGVGGGEPPVITGDTFYVSNSGNDSNDGSEGSPWATIAQVNSVDLPVGGTIYLNRGDSWSEALSIDSNGTPSERINILAYGSGANPKVEQITVNADYVTIDGVDVDQNKGPSNPVRFIDSLNWELKNSEIQNSTNDGVDVRDSNGGLIEDCSIHHCLKGNWSSDPIQDAHGVVATGTDGLTIRRTDIYQVSGDCFQADPNRVTGNITTNVVIEECNFYTAVLGSDFNAGWVTGNSPGENAIDTKVSSGGADSQSITITDLTCYGFLQDANTPPAMSNRAALNLKENISATIDRITVYDSEIAFRVSGDEGNGNADVTIQNALVYDCDTAMRVESNADNFIVYNSTFGSGVTTFLQDVAGGIGTGSDLRNNAFLGTKPSAFSDATNVSASSGDFVDSPAGDYRLVDTATTLVDQGDTITSVLVDITGAARSGAYEIGAYTGFVSTSNMADVFSVWEGNPAFYWGNRMSELGTGGQDDIDTDTLGGYDFETVLADGQQWHSFRPVGGSDQTSIPAEQEGVMQFNVFPGTYLRAGSNIRYGLPSELNVGDANYVTFCWDFYLDPTDYTGGKMFQITASTSRIKFEFNPWYHDNVGSEPGDLHDDSDGVPYVLLPAVRAYSPDYVGGGGEIEPIGCGTGASIQPQPAFPWTKFENPLGTYTAEHLTRNVMIKPGQWTRLIFTFDWTGGNSDQRVWGWLEAEDTPRTLWLHECGDNTQGFRLGWTGGNDPAREGIQNFWWEFNNSSSSSSTGHYILGRDLFVLLDVRGDSV